MKRKKLFILCNGIYSDGSQSVDRFRPLLDGDVIDFKYPRTFVISSYSRKKQQKAGRRLAAVIAKGIADGYEVHLIGHSYGAVIIYRALCSFTEIIDPIECVWLFSAAMTDDYAWPCAAFNKMVNYCSTDDRALRAGNWLPWHVFGTMGLKGYNGPADSRILNVPIRCLRGIFRHGCAFMDGRIEYYANQINLNGETLI